jgi:hypothetical protein
MNASRDHLQEDIRRLTHKEANLDIGFAIHFSRICEPGKGMSRRDCSSASKEICTLEQAQEIQRSGTAIVYYVMSDPTGVHQSGFWEVGSLVTKKLA